MHMSGIKNFAIFPKSRKLAKFNTREILRLHSLCIPQGGGVGVVGFGVGRRFFRGLKIFEGKRKDGKNF